MSISEIYPCCFTAIFYSLIRRNIGGKDFAAVSLLLVSGVVKIEDIQGRKHNNDNTTNDSLVSDCLQR